MLYRFVIRAFSHNPSLFCCRKQINRQFLTQRTFSLNLGGLFSRHKHDKQLQCVILASARLYSKQFHHSVVANAPKTTTRRQFVKEREHGEKKGIEVAYITVSATLFMFTKNW